jgi:hypothetical protein
MITPSNQNEFGVTEAERRKRHVRARAQFERAKVTIAAVITIIVVVGALIVAKWSHAP